MAFHPLRACADLFHLARCVPYFRRYRRLREAFGFDPWHVKSPFPRRRYKRRVVAMVAGFAPETVVEIGCGLGEIVSHSKAKYRFGFDRETAVIAAAEFLHGSAITFRKGDLCHPQDIAAAVGRPIDVLIAVNWPHMLAFDAIETAVAGLAAQMPVRILVIDTIHPGLAGYRHTHTLDDIKRLGAVIATVPGGDAIRDLHAVKLAPRTA